MSHNGATKRSLQQKHLTKAFDEGIWQDASEVLNYFAAELSGRSYPVKALETLQPELSTHQRTSTATFEVAQLQSTSACATNNKMVLVDWRIEFVNRIRENRLLVAAISTVIIPAVSR